MSDRSYGQPKSEDLREATHEIYYHGEPLPPRGTGQQGYGLLNRIVTLIGTNLIKFINLVFLANRDYPYFDYITIADTEEPKNYVVGSQNIGGGGDTRKLFVAKSTLIYCTANTYVRFNNTNNVDTLLLANTWYEFMHNIGSIYVRAIGTDGVVYIYCEGVLPQEQRSPEQ